ncbi:MAG: DNA polymerase III subunit delta [Dehalococcoidia bacterium]|nr:DNA polymerase III subunit delta [Dehalococcoidia bacterium]
MFYIIHGDDNYRCHQTLADIKAGLGSEEVVSVNTTILDGRKLTPRDLSDVCNVVPFLASSRFVIVEGLLKRFQAGAKPTRSNGNNGNGDQQLKEWKDFVGNIKVMPPTTVLVLFDPDLDPKTANSLLKTLSAAADKVFQLNEIKGRELAAWIKEFATSNKSKISAAAVNLLADYIGGDLWMLSSELNKLMTYCGEREITEKDVRDITSFAREDSIFVLVDSIMEGKIKNAQVMLHRMLKYGTAPQQILAMLERQLSIVLRVKELSQGVPQPEIRERLGLHPRYPLDKSLKQARSYTIPRLRKAFHCLLDTDIAIKTGKYEDDLALDIMVIELCKN